MDPQKASERPVSSFSLYKIAVLVLISIILTAALSAVGIVVTNRVSVQMRAIADELGTLSQEQFLPVFRCPDLEGPQDLLMVTAGRPPL